MFDELAVMINIDGINNYFILDRDLIPKKVISKNEYEKINYDNIYTHHIIIHEEDIDMLRDFLKRNGLNEQPNKQILKTVKCIGVLNKISEPIQSDKPIQKYNLGDTVYHATVYNYNIPLTVTGIFIDKLQVKRMFPGEECSILDERIVPLEGTSKFENYGYLKHCRDSAKQYNKMEYNPNRIRPNKVMDLCDIIINLTNHIEE